MKRLNPNVAFGSILIGLLLVPTAADAQSIIPSSRSVDWTQVGLPGGLPDANWPIYKTLSASGGADDSVAIQTAINAAPSGSVILLNAGTYTLHRATTTCYGKTLDFSFGVYQSGLCLTDKSVVLRGQGPGTTIINYGDGAHIISMGKTYQSSSNITMIPVTNSPKKGSNQVTVLSTSGISVGSYIVVTELNPSDLADGTPLINTVGYTGSCGGCGNGLTNNLISQIEQVTAVNGNTLTVEIPLYFGYTSTPTIFRLPNMIESVGLESLTVRGTASSGTSVLSHK